VERRPSVNACLMEVGEATEVTRRLRVVLRREGRRPTREELLVIQLLELEVTGDGDLLEFELVPRPLIRGLLRPAARPPPCHPRAHPTHDQRSSHAHVHSAPRLSPPYGDPLTPQHLDSHHPVRVPAETQSTKGAGPSASRAHHGRGAAGRFRRVSRLDGAR